MEMWWIVTTLQGRAHLTGYSDPSGQPLWSFGDRGNALRFDTEEEAETEIEEKVQRMVSPLCKAQGVIGFPWDDRPVEVINVYSS